MTFRLARNILVAFFLVSAGAIGAAVILAAVYSSEVYDLPGLVLEDPHALQISATQEGDNSQNALKMYWADGLIKGKPYSAEVTTETVEALADGNRIHRHTACKFYRDSQGRMRLDQTLGSPAANKPASHSVKTFIDDPVANASYITVDGDRRADYNNSRSQGFLLEFADAKGPAVLGLPSLDKDRDIVQKGLGTRTIEGIRCRGMRESIQIPAGKIGNERSISVIVETWYAPSIAAVVQSSYIDPRLGQIDYQLRNAEPKEQPASLFEPDGKPIK
jgi:hypothetical protein